MNMDRRTIIVIIATMFSFVAYNYYMQQKYPDYFSGRMAENIKEDMSPEERAELDALNEQLREAKSAEKAGETSPQEGVATSSEPAAIGEPQVERLSPEDLRIETENRVFIFDQDSTLLSVKLKNYRQEQKSDALVELLDNPMMVQGSLDPVGRRPQKGYSAVRDGQTISFSKQQDKFLVEQKFVVPESGYGLDLAVTFTNTSDSRADLTSSLLVLQNVYLPQESGGFGPAAFMAQNKAFIYGLDGSREEEIAKDYCEDSDGMVFGEALNQERLDFIGFDLHYFLAVLSPDTKMNFVMNRMSPPSEAAICPISLVAYQKQGLVEPNQSITLNFKGYFGPKDVELLEKEDPKFTNTVRFGWFSILAKPLLLAVKWFYSLVHNYGIAIIIVTVILKILFFPLTKAAAVSMKKMQKLNPEMTKLREKYKDDPQRQQKELMAFMAKHKVNPAKGCLPILPQIPVFIAFYNVLSQAIELRHAPFFGWIHDLASADPYYITPILLGVGMFVQQKLTPNPSMDKNQEKIMLMMPLIFTVMMLSLPAGMVLYMIANTAVSIAQQQWLNRRLDKQFG
ncbi:membrane protein insertase YidC [Pseudobacteriovorax antillogorgiicola]|uniref:Membrane protein insertase YidC n=1 Tax=Pseudobacteriovorax antillogorgiicola TaxID=1513793 RepID=A0A1Y6CJL7_9BACT|nr:membrane protein insertase YidC [Pseudobacteriovorax antillogorgiicola]TCS46682.1 YidC/Oxa1 family membrane protein insertase [Pseudobacteriovorax antillogorgiicola]SMF66701.1 YidC/Oxa1 family membrane protein insertase [Pseudobacteriovorax antillogorgiicola]